LPPTVSHRTQKYKHKLKSITGSPPSDAIMMTVTGLIKGVSSPLMALSFQALSAEPPVLMVDTVPGDVLMGGGKFSSLLRHNPSFASVECCV